MNIIPTNPNISSETIGALLATARQKRGYSLIEISETTGLTVVEIAAVESDQDFNPLLARRIATALGIPGMSIG